jgi:hypothetical protein
MEEGHIAKSFLAAMMCGRGKPTQFVFNRAGFYVGMARLASAGAVLAKSKPVSKFPGR